MAFFNFDLNEALNGEGFTPFKVETSLDGDTTDAIQKTIEFQQHEMGMFDHVSVVKFPDGTAWLDFASKKYAPNRTLMDFIAYCTDKWGNDSKGQGYPCEQDTPLLKSGHFGRYWPNVKILQCKRDDCFALSIHMRIIIDNQDMSNFAKDLAKGFVRSAVNQVGRDGGRVISNQIYNDRNYVPVSPVGNQQSADDTQNNYAQRHCQSNIPQRAVSATKHFSAGKMVWLTLASVMIMPIGSVIVFLYGLFQFIDKSDKLVWQTTKTVHTPDRRYKTGTRPSGTINVTESVKVDASPEALSIKQRNGKIAMIIGGIGLALFTIMMLLAK